MLDAYPQYQIQPPYSLHMHLNGSRRPQSIAAYYRYNEIGFGQEITLSTTQDISDATDSVEQLAI